jgi:hypothetical protein
LISLAKVINSITVSKSLDKKKSADKWQPRHFSKYISFSFFFPFLPRAENLLLDEKKEIQT